MNSTKKASYILSYGFLIIGQVMLFLALFMHRPKFERSLGPNQTAIILSAGLLFLLIPTGILLWKRKQLPVFMAQIVLGLGRFPQALLFLLFSGLIALVGLLFFYALLDLFLNLPIFIASLLVTYAGFNLLLIAALPTPRFRRLWQNLILMTAGLIIGLFIIEAGLRLLNPYPVYTMLPANARWEFYPTPEVLPGIHDFGLYTTNSIGVRGDEYQEEGRYNILAIGGSTTETTFLDDSETWTFLLEAQLNQENGRPPNLDPEKSVWVGNVGRSGHGLVEHIHALQHFVPQYKIDAVILMAGINDFTPIIQQPDQYHDHYEDPTNYAYYLHRSFYTYPLVDENINRSFPENTAVWNLVYIFTWNLINRIPKELTVEFPDARSYLARRENYLSAPLLTDLPDLSPALMQYRANLLRLITIAKAQNVRLILATQPAIWHENLSPEMAKLLWFGFRGEEGNPDGRYDPVDLRAGLDQFNQQLLNVCKEQDVVCVDLAAEMNGQESYFYDDVHFNEAGSVKVADLLAAYLQDQPIPND